ncbi:hypothetical protein HLK59_13575 [Streptomyces sp. S3(2020)]|uniref:hypothetical protein n=1 Tax=Streptomyces sp. S3(2020) TaxID=2732044 RepID=UPI001489A204|nr:hypothetical protein [Streptomyces sp. S3(2020)]NNN31380.1 hypothetical protein [Streptomyces sp. S3(2020)]
MRRLLWLSVAALLAVGCSAASGRGATAENRPDLWPLSGVLHFTATESAMLHRAEEQEVRKCMAGRGFDYVVVPVGDVEREAAVSPYGLLAESQAAQNGYGLGLRRLQKPPIDPNAQQLSALSERARLAWDEALKGTRDGPFEKIVLEDGPTVEVPTDSCVSVARGALYGASWDRNYYTFQSLSTSIVRDTLEHPLVKAAEDEWAACMRDEGFTYQERVDPLKALKKRLDAAGSDAAAVRSAGKEELRVAVRDAVCQAEVGLAEQIARAQKQVEKALPRARTSLLKDFRKARQTALKRAAAQPAASPSR